MPPTDTDFRLCLSADPLDMPPTFQMRCVEQETNFNEQNFTAKLTYKSVRDVDLSGIHAPFHAAINEPAWYGPDAHSLANIPAGDIVCTVAQLRDTGKWHTRLTIFKRRDIHTDLELNMSWVTTEPLHGCFSTTPAEVSWTADSSQPTFKVTVSVFPPVAPVRAYAPTEGLCVCPIEFDASGLALPCAKCTPVHVNKKARRE